MYNLSQCAYGFLYMSGFIKFLEKEGYIKILSPKESLENVKE
jgi:hypothetical protein